MMYEFIFDSKKNEKLIKERGVNFDLIITLIDAGGLVDVVENYNTQPPNTQKMFLVDVHGYINLVPFIRSKNKIYLKTIIPSRKYTKLYKRGE